MPVVSADGVYYVDLGPDPMFSGGSFTSIYPEDCEFSGAIRDASSISFQLSYSALDQDGNLAVIPPVGPSWVPFIGPWRSYYRLRCGDIAIQAGPITNTSTTKGSDYMTITGKTWEEVFRRWLYPFDGRPTNVNDYVFSNSYLNDELIASGTTTPTGLVYQAYQRDVIRIWSDIMTEMMNIVPYRLAFDVSDLTGLSTIKTNYQLALGDQTSLFSLVDSLATTGEGFDWWVGHDMQVHWGAPYRFGPTSAPTLFYTLLAADLDSGFLSHISFTNDGPASTHVQGTGAGLATQTTLSRSFGYGPAQVQFSRLDAAYDFGDVRNASQLTTKAKKQLSLDINPTHEIPITLDPRNHPSGIEQYWADFRVGRAIWLTMDMGFHRIDSAQQLKSYSARLDNDGNCEVDWTLNQIYDQDPNTGSPEG